VKDDEDARWQGPEQSRSKEARRFAGEPLPGAAGSQWGREPLTSLHPRFVLSFAFEPVRNGSNGRLEVSLCSRIDAEGTSMRRTVAAPA